MKFYLSPIVWENGNAFSFATEFPVTKYQERYQFVNERSMEHFQMNYLMDRVLARILSDSCTLIFGTTVLLFREQELFTLRQAKVVQR